MKVLVQTMDGARQQAQAEILKGALQKHFTLTGTLAQAYVIILNVRTNLGESEALDFINPYLAHAKEHTYKRVILSGDLTPHLLKNAQESLPGLSAINSHNISNICEVVEEAINDNPTLLLGTKPETNINLPRVKQDTHTGIVIINTGCKHACAHCSDKLLSPIHKSNRPEAITQEIERFIRAGCQEIQLEGDEIGSWGEDISSDLPSLMRHLAQIPGDFKIRLGAINPASIKDNLDAFLDALANPKFYAYLHLPLESGSDTILETMRRGHTAKEYQDIIHKAREKLPSLSLRTSVICGYPGESEEDFKKTLELVQELCPDLIEAHPYTARPGTPIATQQSQDQGLERARRVMTAFDWTAFERQKRWVGKSHEVTVQRQLDKHVLCRNQSYKAIVIPGKFSIGSKLKVKITNYTTKELHGRLDQ